MTLLTLSEILDDLQAAEMGMHKFERRYWISSKHFYELYEQGALDDGENVEEFAEWAGHYKLSQKRLAALEQLSNQRLEALRRELQTEDIPLRPAEPTVVIA